MMVISQGRVENYHYLPIVLLISSLSLGAIIWKGFLLNLHKPIREARPLSAISKLYQSKQGKRVGEGDKWLL